MDTINSTYKLANGLEIPRLGFGTWQTPDGQVAIDSVLAAFEAGYRHIDTAAAYNNEAGVGEAIRQSSLSREEIFVTTKLWNSERGYEKTLAAFEVSMEKLGLEYLDLYLIHWPAAKGKAEDWQHTNSETWRAFEELYNQGRIKAIGVSNFMPHHLKPLMEKAKVMPMVNQIEFHPGLLQTQTTAFCADNNILVEAWSPLGSGRLLEAKELKAVAAKYDKSVAQICVRWCLQHGTLPLPKSVTPSRIKENADVFDFEIGPEDMALIDALPDIGGSGLHPDEVNF
ncbi:MAG TPA: aldo/keto reductase [Clostridiales bacterium]|nr:aldo/keto reductase [Clostridiales bacterium]